MSYTFNRLFLIFLSVGLFSFCSAESKSEKWVATWSTAPQLVEPNNNPPSPGLSNNTLRQVVHVSIGGDSLKMRFSNEFSSSPVTLHEVRIAVSKGGGLIDTNTVKVLYFNGNTEVTIAPGAAIISDAFAFALQPLSDVAITIYFGNTSTDVTGHPGSRTTSYILTGNQISKSNSSGAVTTDHWYVINTIEVLAPESAGAVAILGNSITDGRGSGTNKQNRWPDILARRLQENADTREVAVLNEGLGGNCVLRPCLGPSAVSRFKRDVLDQNGIKWAIILEGVNDIGGAGGASGSAKVAQDLIAAYGKMIDSCHARGILAYGATLTPFGGNSYSTVDHENARSTVNEWIRNSGRFDAVIDFDKAMGDPNNPLNLLPAGDTGDHLHPNETGHRMMGEAVDLSLFGADTTTRVNEKYGNRHERFSLLQNYPNPFNPFTQITYTIPRDSFVTIKVYNVLGNEVTTLVNERKPAGDYRVNFNAANLSSGIYCYKLTAGNFSELRKMILMK